MIPAGKFQNPVLRSERCKVTVCMAAYQGERYIAGQLRSILEQLGEGDEVIVVDDHSTDGTCDEVRALHDKRIRLISCSANQGVASSFEEAISLASGEIIFLSDQDDLWMPGKVEAVLRAFASNPGATLLATDAELMDENGVRLGTSYYAMRGRFRSGFISSLIRNKFLGCTMAFRSSLVPKILPFPHGRDVLHDIWIGVVNSIISGSTLFIDKSFVWYRRHSGSLTAGNLSWVRKLRTRWDLLRSVTWFWIKERLG